MSSAPQRSRRRFLQQTAIASSGFVLGWQLVQDAHAKPTDYEGLQSDRYLGPVEVLAKVEDAEVFTEGPAADGDGNLLFTNVPVSKILKWDPRTEKLSVHRDNTNETNGLYFAPDGSLLACEGGSRRVTRTDAKTGKISVLAHRYQGKPFAKPNDLCLDGKGRIYFTSRSGVEDPAGENVKAVYRIDPDGTVAQILAWHPGGNSHAQWNRHVAGQQEALSDRSPPRRGSSP